MAVDVSKLPQIIEITTTHILCPRCHSSDLWRVGFKKNAKGELMQVWYCRQCKTYSIGGDRMLYGNTDSDRAREKAEKAAKEKAEAEKMVKKTLRKEVKK